MRPLAKAVIRAGLVDDSTLAEVRRWKLPVDTEVDGPAIEDREQAVRAIQDALDSVEQVRMQDTDLDIVQRWVDPANQREGKLVLVDGESRATKKVIFCRTLMKEIAIPWAGDTIVDLLTNGTTHMRFTDDKGKHKVFFTDARELYIGDTKAFVVCSVYEEQA